MSPIHKKMKICFIFVVAVLYRNVRAEEDTVECQDEMKISSKSGLSMPLTPSSPQESPASFWYKPDSSPPTAGRLSLNFGNYTWVVDYKRNYIRFQFKKEDNKLMENRIYSELASPILWTRITLGSSQSGYWFETGGDHPFNIHLGELEIDGTGSVKVSGTNIIVSTSCVGLKDKLITSATTSPPETTITTTTPATTTTTTTTIATTSLTTTVLSTTELDTTTSFIDYETITEDAGDDNNTTLNPIVNESKEELYLQQCSNIPTWVWGCVVTMIVFLVLSVVFLIYAIILFRRNKVLLASDNRCTLPDSLPGHLTSPGGYGQQSKDLQFFKPGNNESIVVVPQPSLASYTQTLNMPPGNQLVPNVRFSTGPRSSEYMRSTSCPERSPSLSFPPPPSTPPPERNETVPLFTPNGSEENNRSSSNRARHSMRTSSARKKKHAKDYFDADDENSADNY